MISWEVLHGRSYPWSRAGTGARHVATGPCLCTGQRNELTRADETVVTDSRVTILGPTNLPTTLPHDASLMYSKNVAASIGLIVKDGRLALDEEDEIVRGALVTMGGEIVNRRVRQALEEVRDD